jgi:hypothetical protein
MSTQIKAHIFNAMDMIGKSDKHQTPASQDPMTPLLHEYFVATHGEAYFKKRREAAKKVLDKHLSEQQKEKLMNAVVEVKQNEVGDTCTLVETDAYVFSVEVKNGASFVDMGVLKNTLMKQYRLTATEVEALIEKATDRREPSQSWKVTER